MATAVEAGWVALWSDNPPMKLLARLGEEPPTLTDGLGGWEISDRPQQVAMTMWKGNAPFSMSLEIILDGFAEDRHIETELATLYDVARGRDTQPGTVEVRGIPGQNGVSDWVITSIEQGDCIRRSFDHVRTRQVLTLTLLEYNPPEWESIKRSGLQSAKARTHLVTVKATSPGVGETAAQMARRLHVQWTDLRRLNPDLTVANRHLAVGSKVRAPLPTPSSKKKSSSRKGRG